MDFGDVLNEWEKIKRERGNSQAPASKAWIDARGSDDKDSRELEAADRGRESRRIAALKPEAVLDLHGMSVEEAESAIDAFIRDSARSGFEKVLVIHGKGLHSEGGVPVLKKAARRALEAHPLAGRLGEAVKSEGGSGALWVLIRKRRY